MTHNAWVEMGANAKLFYDAFRGLCRMRIQFADAKANEYIALTVSHQGEFAAMTQKKANFWLHVVSYWERKRRDSVQWEKDYFGSSKTNEQVDQTEETV